MTMMSYAYFSQQGRLLYIASRQSVMVDPGVIEREVSRDTEANAIYLDPTSGEVMVKQPFAVEVSFNLISGIPVGTIATLPQGQFAVEDGDLIFEADVPEAITVHLDHPHHVAQDFLVQTGPEDA